ncbi:unnamed protein product [Eruca vesicaria subsp. sativa]|uniref:F-box domain-containing protein n=1 Tax=Eruca vesicaria subsp. sativa TaxID=29727 RepID=A0ABC8LHJ3_ERUVS|nr:unnamed protein product [Eruca vesicaria subsp. sativa]
MSLPEDIILNILARVPRCHYPTISLVSKHFRSLIASPDIYAIRSLLGCTEHCLYVVLRDRDNNARSLYTLCRKADGKNSRLVLIPCLPALPKRGIFVAVGSKIYVFGVNIDKNDNKMTSTAYSIDCRSHTVQPLPSMPHALMYQTMADVIDDRIYIVGFISDKKIPVVVLVFNTRTQMWEPAMTNLDVPAGSIRRIYGCMVMGNKIYSKKLVYDPKETKWETHDEKLISRKFKHVCVINDVIYYYSSVKNNLKAYDSKKRCWKVVKGLKYLFGEIRGKEAWLKTVRYDGKVVFLIPTVTIIGVARGICCAEVSLERGQGGKIFGKVEWLDNLIAGNFEIIQALDVML